MVFDRKQGIGPVAKRSEAAPTSNWTSCCNGFEEKQSSDKASRPIQTFTADAAEKESQASQRTLAQDVNHKQIARPEPQQHYLSLSSSGWDIVRENLLRMGIVQDNVSAVFPCSPLQEGVLRSSSSYAVFWVWRCVAHDGQIISPTRVEAAWRTAVSRHEIFSTVFIMHPEKPSFMQAILSRPEIPIHQTTTSECPAEALTNLERPVFESHRPKHVFTICQSSTGEVACRLDISHALCDAYSLTVLLRDVVQIYQGSEPPVPRPFSDAIRYIASRPQSETVDYWSSFLHGARPCHFPVSLLLESLDSKRQDDHGAISIPTESLAQVTSYCRRHGMTRSVFLHIAWALTLSHFTRLQDVCFGYMASGRDAPVEGVEGMFGPLANMLMNRIDLGVPLQALIDLTARFLKEHRLHQQTSLGDVQRRLGIQSGKLLFNTMISLLRADPFGAPDKESFSFEKHHLVSPQEFDLVLEGHLHPDSVDLTIYYQTASISRQVARESAAVLMLAVDFLVSSDPSAESEYSTGDISNVQLSNGGTSGPNLSEKFFQYIVSADVDSTVAFWKSSLANLRDPSGVILEHHTPMACQSRTELLSLVISDLKWKDQAPPEIMIKAAWSIVLAQFQESNEALFGATLNERRAALPGVRKLTGSNSVVAPTRIILDWSEIVDEFLHKLQGQVSDIAAYGGLSLHWMRQLSKEIASSCNPELLLDIQIPSSNGEATDEGRGAPCQAFEDYPVIAECRVCDGSLHLQISFDSGMGTTSQITRIANQFEHVLRQIAQATPGNTRLKDLLDISQRDLDQVWGWNSQVPPTISTCMHDLIHSRVLEHPDKLAIDAWDGTLTYRQLDEQSTRLAFALLDSGVLPGAIVPLCFEKSMWMSVARVGVMKAGAASVGIDPKQPVQRLQAIIKQVKAPLILSSVATNELCRQLGGCNVLVVSSETCDLSRSKVDISRQLPKVSPEDTLYAVFTSGSTGTPKGVLLSHQNHCSAATYQHEYFGFNRNSRVLDFSTYAFDAACYNLFHTLAVGGCLCTPPEHQLHNDLSGCIEQFRISLVFMTPSIARHLDRGAFNQLDTLLVGGESVSPSDLPFFNEETTVKVIYGPSECTPMTLQHDVGKDKYIAIGRGVGVCTWIVNPQDYHSLSPIGTVGELWLEGPLVGQGYLHDADKTASSFIQDPKWLLHGSTKQAGRHGRLYRTGDLVRYDKNGSVVFVRRNDRQIKIRGQRVELEEVEKHVRMALQASNQEQELSVGVIAEVIRPQEVNSMLLVVFITLDGADDQTDDEHGALVQRNTKDITNYLEARIPAFMVPTAFIPIRNLPKTITGKVDRSSLRASGTSLWQQFRAAADQGETTEATNDTEKILQEIWISVLNLPYKSVSLDKAFTSLGGDSITAMQIVSRCRQRQIHITMTDILEAKTIRRVAARCKNLSESQDLWRRAINDAESGAPFTLSPIQSKFFEMFPDGNNHFNQGFVLELNRPVSAGSLLAAMKAVVDRHGMLRARYRKRHDGSWEQYLVRDGSKLFDFAEHSVKDRREVLDIAQARQASLDISNGPVVAGDLFRVTDKDSQILALTAHHLVIDLVSWRIIFNDLEEHIKFGRLCSTPIPSFKAWCELQAETARNLTPNEVLPFHVPEADLGFWDLKTNHDNTRANSSDFIVTLGVEATDLLLNKANDPLRTEPIDIILGSYAYSFHKSFPQRNMPAIFVEGHGREQPSGDMSLDVSGTVGWFTTMHPLPINMTSNDTVIDAVRMAKDTRRKVPKKGQTYFASRYHSSLCQEAFRGHDAVELLVNFAGRYQQLESGDGLFRLAKFGKTEPTLEVVAPSSKRIGLIEANMAVQDGRLIINFGFHKHMKHQERLVKWFESFTGALDHAVNALVQLPGTLTCSDLPLLSLSQRSLDRILGQQLPDLGVRAENVVDIYPATPMQEGMLLSSTTGVSSYATYWIWTCTSNLADRDVVPLRLEEAWRTVASRHDILSTIFSANPEGSGFVQIVCDKPNTRVSHMTTSSDTVAALKSIARPSFEAHEPQHALTICQGGREVACRLDINHCLLDAASLSSIVQEITAAYDRCVLPPVPQFKDVIRTIHGKRKDEVLKFWSKCLSGVQPCEVTPSFSGAARGDSKDTFDYITIPDQLTCGISNFCKRANVTRSVFFQVAWAMMLSHLTGMPEVCFGYLSSGRNIPLEGIEKILGPLANMIVARIDLSASANDVLNTTSDQSIQHLKYQHASLAEIQHAIGITGRRLFNTAMSVREADRFETGAKKTLSLNYHDHQDPHEYDLLLASYLDNDKTSLSVQYRHATVSRQLAEEASTVLGKAVEYLINHALTSSEHTLNTTGFTTRELHHDFFKYAVGSTRDSTTSFWGSFFANMNAEHFPSPRPINGNVHRESHVCTRTMEGGSDAGFAKSAAHVFAAWSAVAAKNSGSEEALFGTSMVSDKPPSAQNRPVVPLRVPLEWNEGSEKLLQAVQKQMAAVEPYHRTGLQLIRQISRESSWACNFQAVVVVEDGPDDNSTTWEAIRSFDSTPVVIHCQIKGNRFHIKLRGYLDSMSQSYIDRIADQFEYALGWFLSDGTTDRNTKLHGAVPISSKELQDIWSWNSALPQPVKKCVHELISIRALADPKAPAVCAWDGSLNYEQLNILASRLACEIARQGVVPGSFVPLMFEKSMWTPVAMLAVMKAGAASVALDTTQPKGRLHMIMSQVNHQVVLCSELNTTLAQGLSKGRVFVVSANSSSQLELASERQLNSRLARPDDIIYAVFTSGSTGTPKGTLMTHDNISTMMIHQQDALRVTKYSRVFDFASYAFDVAWDNFFYALMCGGCLCIPSESDRRDNIEGSIRALNANYLHITPTVLRVINWSKVESVTVVTLSGEAVLASDVTKPGPGVRVVDAYGPAETNVVTVHDLTGQDQVSIGRGIGACTWIVDAQNTDQLAPIGCTGELWIEGPLVGRGYLNDPDKTAAAFVENPPWLLRGGPGRAGRQGTLYRTGDLVRYNDDGTIAYLGRKDTQIKLNGQRVELSEVENQIRRVLESRFGASLSGAAEGSGNLQVISEIVKHQSDAAILVTFISLAGAQAMDSHEHSQAVQRAIDGLSERLRDTLPQYMIPAMYIAQKQLPLTASGKVDRQSLRNAVDIKALQEQASRGRPAASRRQPTTDNEVLMGRLWAEVLNVDFSSISLEDSFFQIGGDSVGAMRLVSLARDQEIGITVRDIFAHPTLSELSSVAVPRVLRPNAAIEPFTLLKESVDPAFARSSAARLCEVQENDILDVIPCTPLQKNLLARTTRENGNFMSRHILEMCRDVDADRFRAAWDQVVSRNPILRTRIVEMPRQGYVQVVLNRTDGWMPQTNIDECLRHSEANRMGPGTSLARYAIVSANDSPRRDFAWEMHWALYDGWGLRLLLAEVEKIYYGQPAQPLESMLAFSKYVASLDEKEAMKFWKRQFATAEDNARFPVLQPKRSQPRVDSVVKRKAQGMEWSRSAFTPATIIRAALSLVIARELNSNEAVFGATVMGRHAPVPSMERMAGVAFTAVPVRIALDWQQSVDNLLSKVQAQVTDMVPFEQTGLETISRASPKAAAACDFQTLLVVQSAIKKGDVRYRDEHKKVFVQGLMAETFTIVELGQRSGNYPLYVECQLGAEDDVELRFCFDSSLLDRERLELIMGRFEITLRLLSEPRHGQDKVMDLLKY
ncbi:hypothetical protein HIM_06702 [Hirsutella minnesotensis 3608]|uniref:Carrier domain-containing protein n=1 Tax=Hirsutella minnesotensis 3608 TaxID=1043627 RepID=A0A0F8A4L9_9HYPO|nr:hypothetical protein HIM_06702 [Hirsutella minnesotensis 3608]